MLPVGAGKNENILLTQVSQEMLCPELSLRVNCALHIIMPNI